MQIFTGREGQPEASPATLKAAQPTAKAPVAGELDDFGVQGEGGCPARRKYLASVGDIPEKGKI